MLDEKDPWVKIKKDPGDIGWSVYGGRSYIGLTLGWAWTKKGAIRKARRYLRKTTRQPAEFLVTLEGIEAL